MRAEVVRSSVQAIGSGVTGADGSAGVFETEAMGKAGDFFETAKERKCNFKFQNFRFQMKAKTESKVENKKH